MFTGKTEFQDNARSKLDSTQKSTSLAIDVYLAPNLSRLECRIDSDLASKHRPDGVLHADRHFDTVA